MLHEGYFCMQYSRVWSQQPWMRPLATCIEDATDQSFLPKGYYNHQWVGHCTPEMIEFAEEVSLPIHVLLTKSDKLKASKVQKNIDAFTGAMSDLRLFDRALSQAELQAL